MENYNTTENVAQPAFVPQQIGEEKSFVATGIKSFYENLTAACTALKNELQTCLETKISIDEFLSFLKSKPENWIYSKYIEINNVKYNGLSNEKIIELKMLDIDKVAVDEVLQHYAAFQNVISKMGENKFYYPIRKLYDQEKEIFYGNGELWQKIDDSFTKFTATENQNEILSVFNRLCGILNELEELNILRAKNGPTEIETLSNYIKINKMANMPFTVNPYLFSQNRLSRYKTKLTLTAPKGVNELFV